MKFLKYSIFLFVVLALASCHKDEESTTTGGVTTNPGSVVTTLATNGDVLGYVYDEDNNPVGGASVSLLKESTTTDQYGVFKFKNVELDQKGTYLRVSKSGYILGSDMIYGMKDVNHTSRVKMLRLEVTGTFAATDGGTINVDGGGQVIFSPSSIVTADGSAFSGTVSVTAKRIATDDPSIGDMMPGGLLATDSEGKTVTLGSLGMIAVELRDGSGNELDIAPGSTAEMISPIADFQKSGAPSEINLWSFDESLGLWIEEGVAKREGDNYKATVSHFSFWNYDAWFPVVDVCGKVLYSDGTPAVNIRVEAYTSIYGSSYGYTNQNGSFGGLMPKGEVLTFKISNALCNGEESIIEVEVGPFENKTFLDDIIIELPVSFSFEGQVLCSGDPIGGASVIYTYNNTSYTLESAEDGSFSINVTDDCSDVNQITVFAVDPATGNASSTVTLSEGSPDFDLQVCNDCGFSVTIDTDPTADPCMEKRLLATVDGNGTYNYTWSTGDSGVTTNVTSAGQYCVTVTEADLGCEMVKCSDETRYSILNGELGSSADCGPDGGYIFMYVNGGYPPYTYDWSDPSLTVLNDSIVSGVAEGTYSVTVTDSENCTKIMDIDVVGGSAFSVNIDQTSGCNGADLIATVSGGVAPYTFFWTPNNGQQGQNGWFYAWTDGEYCVTVIDALGCQVDACINVIIEDFQSNIFVDIISCDKGEYTFINSSLSDIYIDIWINNESFSMNQGEAVTIDFIESGFYNIWALAISPDDNCEGEVELFLPHLIAQDSLLTESTVPTCESCTDGSITIDDMVLQNYIGVNGAVIGSSLVINEDGIDVSTEASSGTLPSGIYYAVVTDLNTGCYIYSEKIIL